MLAEIPQSDENINGQEATTGPGMLAMMQVLRHVAATGYRFTPTTPVTHQRALTGGARQSALSLRDVFGWNLPFSEKSLKPELLIAMEQAGILLRRGALRRSAVRIATLGKDLFLHSAHPTSEEHAVFFGPDTYRFARFVRHALQSIGTLQNPSSSGHSHAPLRILDVGCGSGAGGIAAARHLVRPGVRVQITMNDINPKALRYTSVNAEFAGVAVELVEGDALASVTGEFDLIISNPPYLDDAPRRAYRHGGARLGRALSVRIAADALGRLAPGGCLLLYTGVAILDGIDPFHAEMLPLLTASGCDWDYEEIDPDVHGEELERPVYARADRIAAVGLIARNKPSAA